MTKITHKPNEWSEWAYEIFFSLNLTWNWIWTEIVTSKQLGGPIIGHYVITFIRKIPINPSEGVTVLEQFIWSFILTTILFLLVRLFQRLPVTTVILRTFAGVSAFLAFPLAALYSPFTFFTPNELSEPFRIGLMIETLAALTVGMRYSLPKKWLSFQFLIVIMVAHFALWAWVTSSYMNLFELARSVRDVPYLHLWSLGIWASILFHFGSPVIGFLAALTWGRYVKYSSEASGASLK